MIGAAAMAFDCRGPEPPGRHQTPPLILVLVGAVVAAGVFALAASIEPPRFHLARDAELQATYETFRATGVPLVKEHGTGSFYTRLETPPRRLVPAVWDDDPGTYLAAAYVGGALGEDDPYEALRWSVALIAALPWIVLPLAVARLFGNPAAGLATAAAPLIGLALRGRGSVLGTDYGLSGPHTGVPVYALYGLASGWVFLLLSALLLVATIRWRTRTLGAIVVLFGLLAGVGDLLRSWSSIGVAVALGVVVNKSLRTRRVIGGVVAAMTAVALMIGTQQGVMRWVNAQRERLTAVAPDDVPSAHPTWHPLYLGLGYVGAFEGDNRENPFGVEWADDFGWKKARAVQPDVLLNGAEYDQIIRRFYIEAVRRRPFTAVATYLQKAVDTLRQNWPSLSFIALAAVLMLRWGGRRPLLLAIAITTPTLLYGMMPPVAVMPLRYYFAELTAATSILLVIGVGALLAPLLERFNRAGGRGPGPA